MPLSEKARERLQDVRELEPTSNGELRDRWGMDSGSDVARYLRDELGEYVYRGEDSKIRAVADAPDDEPESDGDTSESGATPHETGEASLPDPSPSESDEGAESQAQQADETSIGETLDLQPAEEYDAGGETGDAGRGMGSTGGQEVSLPDDAGPAPDSDDGSGGLRRAGGSADGDREAKPECPECGDVLLRASEFNALMNDLKRHRKDIRRFLQANEGTAVEWACRDIADCGYYFEDGEGRVFNSPKGKRGWGQLALGTLGLAAVGAGALAASQNDGRQGGDGILNDGGGGFGGGSGGRILGGGDDERVV